MLSRFGPQGWWPGRTQFEIVVGAILTQNTAWRNVERAITNMRASGLLSLRGLEGAPVRKIEGRIRPSGYFRQKTRQLKAFCGFLRREYGGSLGRMFRAPTARLRRQLLAVFGIGPETADSILLYAGGHPLFVVDAYTRRIMVRHGWASERTSYEELQQMFEAQSAGDVRIMNEFHALIVNTGKNYCRAKRPLCETCPLGPMLRDGR